MDATGRANPIQALLTILADFTSCKPGNQIRVSSSNGFSKGGKVHIYIATLFIIMTLLGSMIIGLVTSGLLP